MGLTVPGGGGAGTSVASSPSGWKLTHFSVSGAPVVPLAAGSGWTAISFAGGGRHDGDEWYGEGTALPLGATLAGGFVVLPEDDCFYEVRYRVSINCDGADIGKLVGVRAQQYSDQGGDLAWVPVDAFSQALVDGSLVQTLYAGDGTGYQMIEVNVSQLTVDPTAVSCQLFIWQRPKDPS